MVVSNRAFIGWFWFFWGGFNDAPKGCFKVSSSPHFEILLKLQKNLFFKNGFENLWFPFVLKLKIIFFKILNINANQFKWMF